MFVAILIIIVSLITLMALHELGHFLLAKKFKVKVPEFGVGYPPRIWGKKIGETIYSLNWLPFGAFVKILGEDRESKAPGSFVLKPLWQRALILLAGAAAFWVVAIIILTFVSGIWGVPTAIDDDFDTGAVPVQVKVFSVAPNSPAGLAGIKAGDTIIELSTRSTLVETVDKVLDAKEFMEESAGQEVIVKIKRNNEVLKFAVVPRENPPEGEGALGVALLRVANLKTAWYKAPVQAVEIVYRQSKAMPLMLSQALIQKIRGEKVVGVQLVGPIGVGQIMGQALSEGIGSYLILISMLSVWLALFNLLPIPALDGGRLLFLGIEAVRGKPLPLNAEQKVNTAFFIALIALMALITLKDIIRLF